MRRFSRGRGMRSAAVAALLLIAGCDEGRKPNSKGGAAGGKAAATTAEGSVDPLQVVVTGPLGVAERLRRTNDLKAVALASTQFHETQRKLPGDVHSKEADPKPHLSWRTRVLPYLEQSGLAGKFDADQPWDGPANKPLVDQMPSVFRTPGAPPGHTSVFIVRGPQTAYHDPLHPSGHQHVADGLANTLLLVVARPEKAVPWTKPHDLDFDPENPSALLDALPEKDVVVGMFDGSVFVWRTRPAAEVLKAFVTIAGGEAVERPE